MAVRSARINHRRYFVGAALGRTGSLGRGAAAVRSGDASGRRVGHTEAGTAAIAHAGATTHTGATDPTSATAGIVATDPTPTTDSIGAIDPVAPAGATAGPAAGRDSRSATVAG